MSFLKRFFKLALYAAVLAAPLIVWWQWHAIYDWWRLRGYTPPATVLSLANADSMTPKAKHYLYINQPQLVDSVSAFHSNCPDSEKTIVLGCYHPGESGIYIYAVKDSRLAGIQEVTTAHEMLHGAYERLSSKARIHIDALTANFYKTVTDQRIIDEINLYKKTEPKSVSDEMHSVFGTEVSSLPPELETYYKTYFYNRALVTASANGYQAEFTNRTNQINADDKQLGDMKASINAQEQTLSVLLDQLESDRTHLDSLRSSGQIAAYNASVPGYNAEIYTYNAKLNKLHSDITAYNDLVASRNALASELRVLDGAIDTRLISQPAK